MTTYFWAWSDGDGNYINEAQSLREILDEILEYYLDDDNNFKVTELNGKFEIQVDVDNKIYKYDIVIESSSLCEFLNDLAGLVDRPDKFDIRENKPTATEDLAV